MAANKFLYTATGKTVKYLMLCWPASLYNLVNKSN